MNNLWNHLGNYISRSCFLNFCLTYSMIGWITYFGKHDAVKKRSISIRYLKRGRPGNQTSHADKSSKILVCIIYYIINSGTHMVRVESIVVTYQHSSTSNQDINIRITMPKKTCILRRTYCNSTNTFSSRVLRRETALGADLKFGASHPNHSWGQFQWLKSEWSKVVLSQNSHDLSCQPHFFWDKTPTIDTIWYQS